MIYEPMDLSPLAFSEDYDMMMFYIDIIMNFGFDFLFECGKQGRAARQ